MNVQSFFDHWSIAENPFRAEEARHDPVFARLGDGPAGHPDFAKIVGDLDRPATSIVFGEKGSGKTAIRLQLAQRVTEHNLAQPEARVLLVAYDELNPVVDELCARVGSSKVATDGREVLKALKKMRLIDHMDAILHRAVEPLVAGLLGHERADGPDLPDDATRRLRKAPVDARRELVRLQLLYDRDENAPLRTARLRRAVSAPGSVSDRLWLAAGALGWIPAALFVALPLYFGAEWLGSEAWWWIFAVLAGLWLLVIGWILLGRPAMRRVLARRVARQFRVFRRSMHAVAGSLAHVSDADRRPDALLLGETEEPRYEMLGSLHRVLAELGFAGLIVVIDRVDEPMLVNGDPDRMRAIVWPLMNNKFLQQQRLGIKMLLPLELRHELFRESATFFQEARLDKQNLVERLTWSGAMLYDLCNARLSACRAPGAEPIGLADLFGDDVTRQDIVDALDQMRQPRDAFKMLYQCIAEHCSNVVEEDAAWCIPRLTLEAVRRRHADRVQEFSRGMRPA